MPFAPPPWPSPSEGGGKGGGDAVRNFYATFRLTYALASCDETNTNEKIIVTVIASPKGAAISSLLGIASSLRSSQWHAIYVVCIKYHLEILQETKSLNEERCKYFLEKYKELGRKIFNFRKSVIEG